MKKKILCIRMIHYEFDFILSDLINFYHSMKVSIKVRWPAGDLNDQNDCSFSVQCRILKSWHSFIHGRQCGSRNHNSMSLKKQQRWYHKVDIYVNLKAVFPDFFEHKETFAHHILQVEESSSWAPSMMQHILTSASENFKSVQWPAKWIGSKH